MEVVALERQVAGRRVVDFATRGVVVVIDA
jgi:hypothetical protein